MSLLARGYVIDGAIMQVVVVDSVAQTAELVPLGASSNAREGRRTMTIAELRKLDAQARRRPQ